MNKPNDTRNLSNITEMAQALRISTRTVNTLISTGSIPSVRIGRRRLFNIPRVIAHLEAQSDAEAFLATCERQAPGA